MGTGSVALDVVYQQLAKAKLEAGTQVSGFLWRFPEGTLKGYPVTRGRIPKETLSRIRVPLWWRQAHRNKRDEHRISG
jgi:hypothetical protein